MKFKTIAAFAVAGAMSMLTAGETTAQRSKKAVPQSSATYVSAEMTRGRLNPGQSKAGDRVGLRLTNDLRANGQIVLKKGTLIEGIVKSVRRAEGESKTPEQIRSMMEIEWITPSTPATASRQLSIAVQSFTYVRPETPARNEAPADWRGDVLAPPAKGANQGVSGTSNAALMSMPSVVAVDTETASAMENIFGLSANELYRIGRGEVISAGGARHSMDIFSHMSNDTVITSESENFDVSSGARLELLVGVRK